MLAFPVDSRHKASYRATRTGVVAPALLQPPFPDLISSCFPATLPGPILPAQSPGQTHRSRRVPAAGRSSTAPAIAQPGKERRRSPGPTPRCDLRALFLGRTRAGAALPTLRMCVCREGAAPALAFVNCPTGGRLFSTGRSLQ